MAITYNMTILNNRLQVVLTSLDAGSSFARMRLLAGTNTIAVIILNKPSATIASGIMTFSGLPLAAPTVSTGIINSANLEDSAGTVIASGLTTGNSTSYDIYIANTSVSSGQSIALTYGSITGR